LLDVQARCRNAPAPQSNAVTGIRPAMHAFRSYNRLCGSFGLK
jgi:hypothetical protein